MQAIIKQNFAWTIGYNLVAIPLAASGIVAPWMAAIGMSASSLIVVLNALRLKS
jgi:Cu2+-exporting ATPase